MSSLRAFSIRATISVATWSLTILLFAFPGAAQSNSSDYIFVLASGFLCDPGDSSTCPATAKANPGDSYELSGAGTFNARNKSVKAAGTYTHKSLNGIVLETGVWLATELVSFDSYGAAPGALRHKGLALGPDPFDPKLLPMFRGPMPTGGLAVFRVRFLPISGAPTTAVLQANCALGKVPPERQMEGIRLSLERNSTEFSEEVSGRVMFLSTRPEVNAPANRPQQEPAPESGRPPSSQE